MSLTVDLAKHDVEGAQNTCDVGQHVAAAHEIHALEVGETRGSDPAAISLVGTVRHEIDAELALRGLHGRIDLARRDVEAFRVKLEVVISASIERFMSLRDGGATLPSSVVTGPCPSGALSLLRHWRMIRTLWRISSMRITWRS